MKVLVQKSSRPADVVMVLCAGTRFTAKACMLSGQRSKFVKCYASPKLLTGLETDLVFTFTSQV